MPAPRSGDFDRYLLDGERLVTAVHAHWVKIAEPVASFVGMTVLAFYVDLTVPADAGLLAQFIWFCWWLVLGRLVYRWVQWRRDWFVATDKRLLLFYGFLTRKAAMMPLGKVTDMSYHRSIPGRVLGYGTFVMESAGQDQALSQIDFMPDPDHNYRAICAEIFGVPDSARVLDDDGDDGPGTGGYADGAGPGRGPGSPGGGSDGGGSDVGPAAPHEIGGRHWVRRLHLPRRHSDETQAPWAEQDPGSPDYDHSREDWTDTSREVPMIQARHQDDTAVSLYRSADLEEADRERRRAADTGELPLYVPREWH